MKYRVTLEATASFYVEVDADGEEEAIEAAFEESPYLCAQCSGWGNSWGVDLTEWDVPRNPDGSEADGIAEPVED